MQLACLVTIGVFAQLALTLGLMVMTTQQLYLTYS